MKKNKEKKDFEKLLEIISGEKSLREREKKIKDAKRKAIEEEKNNLKNTGENTQNQQQNEEKNTDNKDIYIMVKVSNAATPLTIYGATVRIYTMTKDSFGSSQSKVTKYLDGNGLVEKDYLNDIQLKDEKLEYIAEITDDFGSR